MNNMMDVQTYPLCYGKKITLPLSSASDVLPDYSQTNPSQVMGPVTHSIPVIL